MNVELAKTESDSASASVASRTSFCGFWSVKSNIGYPVVMKLISGFAGKGVVLIHDKKQLESILDAVHLFEEFTHFY